MRGKKHSEEQVIAILKQTENGLKTAEVCRQHGISEQRLYRWKAKYGGLESSEAKKLRVLEVENRKLKSMVAEMALDNRALKDVLSKIYGPPLDCKPHALKETVCANLSGLLVGGALTLMRIRAHRS